MANDDGNMLQWWSMASASTKPNHLMGFLMGRMVDGLQNGRMGSMTVDGKWFNSSDVKNMLIEGTMPMNWMIWYYQVLDQASKITVSWRTLDLHWLFDLSTALSFATASFQQVELVPRSAKICQGTKDS